MEAKKSRFGWAFWLVFAMLPVLYVASIGPACWLVTRKVLTLESVLFVYKPVIRAIQSSPKRIRKWSHWYCDPKPPAILRLGSYPIDGSEAPLREAMELLVWWDVDDGLIVVRESR